MTQIDANSEPPAWCEHGPGGHVGVAASSATAPADARAWLLIESEGPWAAEAVQTPLPAPLAKLAIAADELGVRVQLIRRPGPGGESTQGEDLAVYLGWTAGEAPWLRRIAGSDLDPALLAALAAGELAAGERGAGEPGARESAGTAESGPLYLVCAHGRRDRCCARFGVPLARELADRYPDQVWETTHVGGHRFAANLVILPHGLYYGPVDSSTAHDAIDAFQRGEITARRYRGRAGQDAATQEAESAALAASGTLSLRGLLADTTCSWPGPYPARARDPAQPKFGATSRTNRSSASARRA